MKILTHAALATFLILGSSFTFAQQQQQEASSAAESPSLAHMNEIMQRIRTIEDPEERAALLEAHLNEMHTAMAQMHAMMGQLMQHVEQQRTESRRLHDHAASKR